MRPFSVEKDNGVRISDLDAFRMAAKLHRVYVLLRKTNAASLEFVGKAGYTPKGLECKAKTADENVFIAGRRYETAGLVVDPDIVTYAAFGAGRQETAIKEWLAFKHLVARDIYDASGKPSVMYHTQYKYRVQMDPTHKHYGCVIYSSTGAATAGAYLHSDYDLYAIVPVSNMQDTEYVVDRDPRDPDNPKKHHYRSKHHYDVQIFINSRIGAPMILHGDEEKFKDHDDATVYVFNPGGPDIFVLENEADIRNFYASVFKGRKTGGPNVRSVSAGGDWRKSI